MSTSDSPPRQAIGRTATPRTAIRDAILASLSKRLGPQAVAAVEWAALDDTRAAIQDRRPTLAYWDEYNRAHEVAL